MTVKDITNILEDLAPLSWAEEFDNVGLLVGDPQTKVSGILVSLDTLENISFATPQLYDKLVQLRRKMHNTYESGTKNSNGLH